MIATLSVEPYLLLCESALPERPRASEQPEVIPRSRPTPTIGIERKSRAAAGRKKRNGRRGNALGITKIPDRAPTGKHLTAQACTKLRARRRGRGTHGWERARVRKRLSPKVGWTPASGDRPFSAPDPTQDQTPTPKKENRNVPGGEKTWEPQRPGRASNALHTAAA